jgi:hypothetical protein
MMDTTGISAATLAKYYELLNKGILSSVTATDDFIQVLDKLNAASNVLENSFAFLETWEPSKSGTEVAKGFIEMRDSMFELYNSGAFGDQALQDYIEQFIGADNWEKILKEKNYEVKAAMQEVMLLLRDFDGNFKEIWSNIAKQG